MLQCQDFYIKYLLNQCKFLISSSFLYENNSQHVYFYFIFLFFSWKFLKIYKYKKDYISDFYYSFQDLNLDSKYESSEQRLEFFIREWNIIHDDWRWCFAIILSSLSPRIFRIKVHELKFY